MCIPYGVIRTVGVFGSERPSCSMSDLNSLNNSLWGIAASLLITVFSQL